MLSLKSYTLITYLLSIISFNLYAQTDEQLKALQALNDARNDTSKINAYIDLHNAYFKSDPDKSYYYAQQILATGKQMNSAAYILKGYLGMARCERKKRNYKVIFTFDSLALKYAIQYGSLDVIYLQQIQLIHDYLDAKRYKDAFRWFKVTESTAEQLNKPKALAELSKSIGYYYRETNQHKKALPYYRKAIAGFEQVNDEYNIAETKMFLAQSLSELGKYDSTAELLFDALAIYTKRNSQSRMGMINELLGDALLANGDADKGIEHYLEAKRLYAISNNSVEEGLCLPYLARAYMVKKDYATAKKYIDTAQALFNKMDYEIGKITVQTLWGQYYSETGEPVKADSYFTNAASMLKDKDLPDLKTDNEKYWSQHKFRIKQFKAADSLLYTYTDREANSKEPEVMARELRMIKEKNRNLDSNSLKILSLLYVPGGTELLKKELKNQSLSEVLHEDNLMNLSPFSYATATYDSSLMLTYHKQLLDLETKYKTQQINDSLRIANQNILLARSEVQNKNVLLAASALVALLLSAGFWLQYKNRKTAERDKAKIELLQGEINHRITNNLAIVKRFAEIADKADKKNLPLASLQSRIDAIELLHKNLYQSGKAGVIPLQQYLSGIAEAIQATFVDSDKQINIMIDAPLSIDMQTAEKLGLIINELMTNSFKYAFKENATGEITITAKELNDQHFTLRYTDNGAGFTGENISRGYGSKLIEGLARELNASFDYKTTNGVVFTITV